MPEMDESDNSNVKNTIEHCQRTSTTRDRASQSWAGAPKTGFASLAGRFTKGIVKKLSIDGLRWGSEHFLMNPFVHLPAKEANPVLGAPAQL